MILWNSASRRHFYCQREYGLRLCVLTVVDGTIKSHSGILKCIVLVVKTVAMHAVPDNFEMVLQISFLTRIQFTYDYYKMQSIFSILKPKQSNL